MISQLVFWRSWQCVDIGLLPAESEFQIRQEFLELQLRLIHLIFLLSQDFHGLQNSFIELGNDAGWRTCGGHNPEPSTITHLWVS